MWRKTRRRLLANSMSASFGLSFFIFPGSNPARHSLSPRPPSSDRSDSSLRFSSRKMTSNTTFLTVYVMSHILSDSVSRMSSSTHFARYSEPSDW